MQQGCLYGRSHSFCWLFSLVLYGLSSTVSAGVWLIQPSISISKISTDNVNLTATEEVRDRITEIAPSISIARSGEQLSLDINYAVQGVYYDKSKEHDSTFSQVNAFVVGEIIDEFFFTEMHVARDQQIVSPLRPVVSNNYIITENRTDSTTLRLSPYLRSRLSNRIDSEFRYSFNKIDYSDESIDDSTSNEALIEVGSSNQRGGIEWRLVNNYNKVKYRTRGEDSFSSSSLEVVKYLMPRFGVIALVGYEKNEYETRPGQERPEGSIWEGGIRWAPTARRNLEARGGERYFGDVYSLRANGNERYLNWSIEYSEEAMSTVQVQIDELFAITEDDRAIGADDRSLQDTSVFIRKYFSSSIIFSVRRTELMLSLFRDRRDYQLTLENEISEGIVSDFRWQLFPRTTVAIENSFRKQSFRLENREDDVSEGDIGIEHLLSPRTRAELAVGYTRRESTNSLNDYRSNIVMASLEYEF